MKMTAKIRNTIAFFTVIGISTSLGDISIISQRRLPINERSEERSEVEFVAKVTSKSSESQSTIKILGKEFTSEPRQDAPLPKVVKNESNTIVAINFRPVTDITEAYLIIQSDLGLRIYPKLGAALEKQMEDVNDGFRDDNVKVSKIIKDKIYCVYLSKLKGVDSFKFVVTLGSDGKLIMKREEWSE